MRLIVLAPTAPPYTSCIDQTGQRFRQEIQQPAVRLAISSFEKLVYCPRSGNSRSELEYTSPVGAGILHSSFPAVVCIPPHDSPPARRSLVRSRRCPVHRSRLHLLTPQSSPLCRLRSLPTFLPPLPITHFLQRPVASATRLGIIWPQTLTIALSSSDILGPQPHWQLFYSDAMFELPSVNESDTAATTDQRTDLVGDRR